MMFAILRQYGIPKKIVDAIYINAFHHRSASGQRACAVSVHHRHRVHHEQKRRHLRLRVSPAKQQQPAERLNDLDYADDLALLERFYSLANDQLRALSQEASKVGLKINL